MNIRRIQDCERTKIEKLSKFQLSHKWKNRAITFSLLIIVSLITLKFIDGKPYWIGGILKRALLVGLLMIALSKEKIEDEMVASLRAKSFTLSFIMGVLYALIQPMAELFIDFFILKSNPSNTFSYFDVLLYMLLIQIMFFEILKRNR